jgi:hypothetical protein
VSSPAEVRAYRQGLYDGEARAEVQLNRAIKAEAIVHAMMRHLGATTRTITTVLASARDEAARALPDAGTAERRLFAAELVLATLRLRVRRVAPSTQPLARTGT